MGDRRFASELERLRRRQAAVRGLLSRRDALCAVLASGAPLFGCASNAEQGQVASGGLGGRKPYSAGGSGGELARGDGGAGTGGGPSASAAEGGAGDAGAAGGTPGAGCSDTAGACASTPDNILGPFYKDGAPLQHDLARGVQVTQPLEVRGRVVSCDCQTPLAGATVDVWQADEDGAYDNDGFLLRGRVQTDSEGNYQYTSLLPGAYLNGAQYRPKHIHYKVTHPGARTLVTQLYFEGDPYIPADPFVREALVMPLSEQSGIYRVTFDIVLL